MSVSKEVRIGFLVTIALVIFFAGFSFLKGSNLLSNDIEYYCFYDNVDGLQKSANVQIRGMNVGRVSAMQLIDNQGIKVTISLDKSVVLPEGTVATLAAYDLLGTKMISLTPGPGHDTRIKPGTTLPSTHEVGIVDKVSAELTPRLQEMKRVINGFDTTLTSINVIVGPQNQAAIAEAIQSIKSSANSLSQLSASLNKESGEITGIIHNANSVTANLSKNNDTINHILAHISSVSRQLSNAPLQKTLTDLQKATSEFEGIMEKINSSQGSLGMLINNKDVYNSLNSSIKSLNNLTDDLKAHPGRYIHISVFGKKKD